MVYLGQMQARLFKQNAWFVQFFVFRLVLLDVSVFLVDLLNGFIVALLVLASKLPVHDYWTALWLRIGVGEVIAFMTGFNGWAGSLSYGLGCSVDLIGQYSTVKGDVGYIIVVDPIGLDFLLDLLELVLHGHNLPLFLGYFLLVLTVASIILAFYFI